MTRMTKSNARDILSKTLDQFQKITGETAGACFTWKGSLSVIGSTKFRETIGKKTDEIWRCLYRVSNEIVPLKDEKMGDLLLGDVDKYDAATLRKMISWATQKSTGRVRNFWGLEECRPVWWPSDIPLQGITNPAQSNKKVKKMLADHILLLKEI